MIKWAVILATVHQFYSAYLSAFRSKTVSSTAFRNKICSCCKLQIAIIRKWCLARNWTKETNLLKLVTCLRALVKRGSNLFLNKFAVWRKVWALNCLFSEWLNDRKWMWSRSFWSPLPSMDCLTFLLQRWQS